MHLRCVRVTAARAQSAAQAYFQARVATDTTGPSVDEFAAFLNARIAPVTVSWSTARRLLRTRVDPVGKGVYRRRRARLAPSVEDPFDSAGGGMDSPLYEGESDEESLMDPAKLMRRDAGGSGLEHSPLRSGKYVAL